MKKNPTRDYAAAAFAFYAAAGGPEPYRRKMWAQTIEQGGGAQQEKQAMAQRAAELQDLEAVERTLQQLSRLPAGREAVMAVHLVYMLHPGAPVARGDISARVQRAALLIPAGEASVYRYLAHARRLFAMERGLRV
nr:hypothetical protein [Maliibacterium massiliense]